MPSSRRASIAPCCSPSSPATATCAVDVFTDRAAAEGALAEVLADEPAFIDLLDVITLEDPPLVSVVFAGCVN